MHCYCGCSAGVWDAVLSVLFARACAGWGAVGAGCGVPLGGGPVRFRCWLGGLLGGWLLLFFGALREHGLSGDRTSAIGAVAGGVLDDFRRDRGTHRRCGKRF